MDEQRRAEIQTMADAYDDEARETGWFGPEVIVGLAHEFLATDQQALDIGIGTGLTAVALRRAGLRVRGLDHSADMLDACRLKGFTDLVQHDLTEVPYPGESASLDLVTCTGVLNFFADLAPVFGEAARLLRPGGLLAIIVGDRADGEPVQETVAHGDAGETTTMFRHSAAQIADWAAAAGFEPLKDLAFTVFMDRRRTCRHHARAYLMCRSGPLAE